MVHRAPVCCVFGKPVAQEESLQAVRSLEHHIVHVLGAESLDRWTVEVAYKLKQRKKPMGSEMKFGVNVSAPFIGMKQDEGSDYPYAKHAKQVRVTRTVQVVDRAISEHQLSGRREHRAGSHHESAYHPSAWFTTDSDVEPEQRRYCVRRSDRGSRVLVVQEMAEEAQESSSLPEGKLAHVLEGTDGLDAVLAAKAGLVTRLKATVDGHAYRLGDFVLRVGSCRKGAVYRGLALEVEYTPCCRVADGLAMIEAFLPSIDEDGTFAPTSNLRDPMTFGSDPQFSVEHTALQITDLFNKVFA